MKVTKEQIIIQSLNFFVQNDYDGASLKDIAAALSITKGGIYHYFKSKEELFKEAVIYALGAMENLSIHMTTSKKSFKETIKTWFALGKMAEEIAAFTEIDMLKDYYNIVYLLFTAIKKFPEVRETLGAIYSKTLVIVKELFDEAQNKGLILDEIDTKALAFELVAFDEGAILLASVTPNLDLEDMGERAFKNFWRRITP